MAIGVCDHHGTPLQMRLSLVGDVVVWYLACEHPPFAHHNSVPTPTPLITLRLQPWPRRVLLALPMAAALVSLDASELVMTDVNLGIESLPTAFDFTIRDGASSTTGDSEFDYGFGLGGRMVYAFSSPGAPGAFFLGGSLALGGYTYDEDGTYAVGMARAVGGYAYAFNDQWTVEVSPWIGYGFGRLHIPGGGVSDDHDVAGTVFDYGAHLGVTYALSRSWLVGARVGWQVAEADLSGDGLEVALEQSGPTAFLGIVYRFSGAPPSIR